MRQKSVSLPPKAAELASLQLGNYNDNGKYDNDDDCDNDNSHV